MVETWVEALKQHWVSAVQLSSSYVIRTSNEAMSEDSWEDETGIRLGRAARAERAYLQDLGCIQPEYHGLKGHTCSLGNDKTILLKILGLYHHQELPLLRAMRARLPEELVAKILAEVALNNTNGVISFNTPNDLRHISAGILSDRIPEATPYRPLLERAILETLPIRLDIIFDSGGSDGEVIAKLPDFAFTLLPLIRTLVLCVGVEESLSLVINGMMSLRSQLIPFRLHDFVIEITTAGVTGLENFVWEKGRPALKPLVNLVLGSFHVEDCGKKVTFREDCESLIEAVRSAGIGRTQYLRMSIVPSGSGGEKAAERSPSWTAITSAGSAAEIVDCAVQNDLEESKYVDSDPWHHTHQ